MGLVQSVGNRSWVGYVPQQIYPSLCKDFSHDQWNALVYVKKKKLTFLN